MERNYRLYGIDVNFYIDDELGVSDLNDDSIGRYSNNQITPDSFNRAELGEVRYRYHDDRSRLHLFWGNYIRNDEPKTIIDNSIYYNKYNPSVTAWNNGAPKTDLPGSIEQEFGVMIASNEIGNNDAHAQATTIHELGHALSIGYADDAPIQQLGVDIVANGFEVYSGSTDPDLTGGVDSTPERVEISGSIERRWSVMGPGSGDDLASQSSVVSNQPVFLFIIEELTTYNKGNIPSINN